MAPARSSSPELTGAPTREPARAFACRQPHAAPQDTGKACRGKNILPSAGRCSWSGRQEKGKAENKVDAKALAEALLAGADKKREGRQRSKKTRSRRHLPAAPALFMYREADQRGVLSFPQADLGQEMTNAPMCGSTAAVLFFIEKRTSTFVFFYRHRISGGRIACRRVRVLRRAVFHREADERGRLSFPQAESRTENLSVRRGAVACASPCGSARTSMEFLCTSINKKRAVAAASDRELLLSIFLCCVCRLFLRGRLGLFLRLSWSCARRGSSRRWSRKCYATR
jgi:hypothetical protein